LKFLQVLFSISLIPVYRILIAILTLYLTSLTLYLTSLTLYLTSLTLYFYDFDIILDTLTSLFSGHRAPTCDISMSRSFLRSSPVQNYLERVTLYMTQLGKI